MGQYVGFHQVWGVWGVQHGVCGGGGVCVYIRTYVCVCVCVCPSWCRSLVSRPEGRQSAANRSSIWNVGNCNLCLVTTPAILVNHTPLGRVSICIVFFVEC